MKKVTTIIVVCSLLFQCAIQLGIVGWYQLNKKYVAEVLCVNRDKKQMRCNGKCYLRKQLNKTEERQKHNSAKSEHVEFTSFILPASGWGTIQYPYDPFLIHVSFYQQSVYTAPLANIFHPPPAV